MGHMDDARFLHWLMHENGYHNPKPLGDGRYAAIVPMQFTHAIVVGQMGDKISYDDRWCYGGQDAARKALDAWDGTGEPQGWHRHPRSGRRRTNGDPAMEYVNQ